MNYQSKKENSSKIVNVYLDANGIPIKKTDGNGNVIWQAEYDALGKIKNEQNLQNVHQPFRLQGQYYDKETGLHYNGARYYDPNIGRFITQDPIGLAGGSNFYSFAPNVQNWIDPLGLAKVCTRPLSGLTDLPIVGDVKSETFLGTNADLSLSHTHIFYDDGTNIGYGNQGLFSETDNKVIKKYKCDNKHYDDERMKQAVKTISARKDNIFSKKLQYSSKNYNVITNNCHDFGTEVKKEYERIPFKKKALRDLIIK